MFDLLIEKGTLVDGTGARRAAGCIGVKGDLIVALDAPAVSPARTRLDASGKVVAPGFVDIHTHSDIAILRSPTADSFVRQGVTTQVVGSCGLSFVPVGGENEKDFRKHLRGFSVEDLPFRWRTLEEYRQILAEQRPATNVACQVGQLPLRTFVIGWVDGPPSASEISRICSLAEEVIEQGAVGISLGLEYFPGSHSSAEELLALGKVAAKKDVPISVHLRNEAQHLLEAVEEAVSLAEESGCQVELSHLKAGGKSNWGKVREAVSLLEEARARGVNIAYDAYPYTSWVSTLLTCVPARFVSDGPPAFAARLRDPAARQEIEVALAAEETDPSGVSVSLDSDRITIAWVTSEANDALVGKTLAQIAEETSRPPVSALLSLLEQEEGNVGAIVAGMAEEDVAFLMGRPECVIISDGASIDPAASGSSRALHPRFFGSFARFLAEYVRKQRLCSLEEAVHRITQMPAERYHLERRGLLKPGYFADIVVFDPETIQDRATYLEPGQFPDGIAAVIVNGQIAWQTGMEEPARSGRVV